MVYLDAIIKNLFWSQSKFHKVSIPNSVEIIKRFYGKKLLVKLKKKKIEN